MFRRTQRRYRNHFLTPGKSLPAFVFSRHPGVEAMESRLMLTAAAWSIDSPLPSPRGDAAALSTTSGAVYVFGGASGSTASNSVLALDPASNLSATTETSMTRARAGLGVEQDGFYALIYGGTSAGVATSSDQPYTVITNDGEGPPSLPAMSVPRSYFASATDSATGEIFAIGGLSTSNQTVATAEDYNPATNTWSPIAPLPIALSAASGAGDGAGHIFVFGGKTAAGTPVSTVYRYTVATNTWDARASMPVAVSDATAVYAFYGSIYVAGGKSATGAVNNFELYNPVLDTWTDQGPLPAPVYGAAGVVDYNSNLDLIGGFNSTQTAVNTVESTPLSPTTQTLPQPPTLNVTSYLTYNGSAQPATATAVDAYGNPIAGTFTFTYNGSSTAPTDAGTYAVVARFTSQDSNFVDGAVDGTLTISQAYPAVNVTGGGTFTYNGQPHAISATATGVDGQTPVSGSFTYAYNTSNTTLTSSAPVSWNTYTAYANFTSTDPNYSDESQQVTLTIPDPHIPTGLTVTGSSTTTVNVAWNPVTLPTGATPTYTVLEQIVKPGYHTGGRGSQGVPPVYSIVVVASGLSGTSLNTAGAIPPTGQNDTNYFEVESVDSSTSPATVSTPTSLVYGDFQYAPVTSGAFNTTTAEVGATTNYTLTMNANPAAIYTLGAHPSSMTIDPGTGVISYTPVAGESGSVIVTETGTNAVGSATQSVTFNILQRPTVVVTGGTFSYDGQAHAATAVAYGLDGSAIAGSFTFGYTPTEYPNDPPSTAPYASVGSYNVIASFNSFTAGYGSAAGTAVQTISQSSFLPITFPGTAGLLSVDPTGTYLQVWGSQTGGTWFTQQIPLASFTTLSVTGSYLGTNLTIDFTNGSPIPADGLTFAGGDVSAANSINLTDYSRTNDAIAAGIGQILVNGGAIDYTQVGYVSLVTTGSDSLTVSSGSVHLPGGSGSTDTTQYFSSIGIGSAASLIVDPDFSQTGRTIVDTAGLSIAGSAGAWTGTLDLSNNDLIVSNTAGSSAASLATLTSQLSSGFAGGSWTGSGIDSSAAAADSTSLTTLGITQNTSATLFRGVPVDSNSMLIKYTYYGDSDLSGVVDGSDYSRIDNAQLTGASGWNNGDFNYDGIVDGSDYTLIDNAFNSQGSSLAAMLATPAAAIATSSPDRLASGLTPAHVFQTAVPISISLSTDPAIELLQSKKDLLDNLQMR